MIGLLRSPVSSPRGAQYLHGKQQENIEHYAHELDHAEDAHQKTSYNPVTVVKQARMLTPYFPRKFFKILL